MSTLSVLHVLRRLASIEITGSLIYRVQFFVYMSRTVVNVVVGLFIWTAVEASGADLPMNREQIVSYYLMLAIVQVLTATWHNESLAQNIREGALNSWLIRPGSYLLNLVANNIAEKLIKIVAVMILLLPAWFIYRHAFVLPADIVQWLLFAVATVLAAIMQFSLTTAIGSLGFWLDDNAGIARGRHVIGMTLSGELVPLALYPTWAMSFLNWQPFRFMLSFPLEVLLGTLSVHQLITGFAMQLTWTSCFVWLAWFVWQRGLRSYTAVGA